MSIYHKIKETLIEAFFPSDGGCIKCNKLLLFERDPFCHSCIDSIPWIHEVITKEDESQEMFFEKGLALFRYTQLGKTMIQEVKFNGNKKMARWIGKKMASQLKKQRWRTEIDMILPIPLHPNRLKERGFNQSEELAKGLVSSLNTPLFNQLLIRIKDTAHQTNLNREERQENIKNAFKVFNPSNIEGKTILLIDDVYTTGSTINACGKVLREAGAKKVYFLVAATGRTR